MRHTHGLRPALAASFCALLLLLVAGSMTRADARGGQGTLADLRIAVSVNDIAALSGDTLTFTSTTTNAGAAASPALILNLNFVAVDHSTAVDPEDWSTGRTVPIPSIAAGASVTQTWSVTAVTKGNVDAFIVVLPDGGQASASEPLISSPAIHLRVTEQRQLNPGGVLPVVIAVPGLIAAAFVGLQLSRRRN